ncbi:dTDP-glucose 4,6-dehydratase [Clostridiales bacterium F-3ap]|uniref:dTDP-glucose 4,6-dehydratase n=2 Tax=Anaerotalea alkaliphila TaxID=2662126 RepID=A0A7X5HUK4_9FIRM|nr:dTDP-glucose 4,6-dehydratase [Anaerotalea alkaliphila]
MKCILVTGGAGFIGSHFVEWMLARDSKVRVVNLDALTYAGSLGNLQGVLGHPRHIFLKGDIRDKGMVEEVFNLHQVDQVVNLAAQSHVDRSIQDPSEFVSTNVLGTQVLLDAALKAWRLPGSGPGDRSFREGVRFLQVSTDEVYGAIREGRFTEESPLAPNSPYAASKAGADLLVRAYSQTYGLPVNVTRCSNNYGPRQHPEKLIPRMAELALAGRPLPVYGDGLQVRDWLHVRDHCAALSLVLERGNPGEVYNIGGDNEQTNLEIVGRILRIQGRPRDLVVHVEDRLGHDRRYAVDHGKITRELGWRPTVEFTQGLEETVR